MPVTVLSKILPLVELRRIGSLHGISVKHRLTDDDVQDLMRKFDEHGDHQTCCKSSISVLRKANTSSQKDKNAIINSPQEVPTYQSTTVPNVKKLASCEDFPPKPPTAAHRKKIIRQFCEESSALRLEETGCAVCGSLARLETTKSIDILDDSMLQLLKPAMNGLTRQTRSSSDEPICDMPGPVIDSKCSRACISCVDILQRGKTPTLALANGIWLGDVPPELTDLSYVEKLLIARVRHNRCIVRVASSGMNKMMANVIAFEQPTHKVYNFLPPPVEELDEMLAVLFTGPCAPTDEDFKRTPLLDYARVGIDYNELGRYPESGPPVSIEYRKSETNKLPEATSVHDMETNDGNYEGPCPFTALKALAVRHLMEGGNVLAVGHNDVPESIFNNPQLYPQMFPWLFPYGLGGIGQDHFKRKLSSARHKRHLLLYHDKRFQ
ncbi:hypothetical protein BJ138DRAFT_1138441 [Hygrophoropsis aurantiaca]|uniref:Uncharacterized protein n=1 Tax=Hygrophoropsis aurantiaca TaxID=72124 RepID=A0ACB7ZVU1_9AGAM|nr:hypothetical protein BJ138DRAFT_1138441 [Hygrophoropsis aurantiaca]